MGDQEIAERQTSIVPTLDLLPRRTMRPVRKNRSQGVVFTEGRNMLVLSRKCGEGIVIGEGVTLTVLATSGDRVKLGVVAPAEVPVHREEIYQRIADCPAAFRFADCA